MWFIFLVVKPAVNNTMKTLEYFEVYLLITDKRIEPLRGKRKLGKSYVRLISRNAFTKEKVIGKLE